MGVHRLWVQTLDVLAKNTDMVPLQISQALVLAILESREKGEGRDNEEVGEICAKGKGSGRDRSIEQGKSNDEEDFASGCWCSPRVHHDR